MLKTFNSISFTHEGSYGDTYSGASSIMNLRLRQIYTSKFDKKKSFSLKLGFGEMITNGNNRILIILYSLQNILVSL